MNRFFTWLLVLCCILALSGCAHVESDYPAAIMVEGGIYLLSVTELPGEIDESAIIGYTTSYTDTFPKKDGQTNFNRELHLPYARVEGGIAILYDHEWHLCTPYVPKDAETVTFAGRTFEKSALSEETLEWLSWYQSLSEEEQHAISSIPHELYELSGYPDAEDAEAYAAE